ncbi:MAG: hypothetical protein JNL10_03175 [Verrucomicrobiales bacterium]|nr:hypothetical protein [Verrucomicrobiales bacterium]
MTRSQLRQLTTLATTAAAGLLPLDHDPEGRDHHGGRIANPAQTLAGALDALEEAGRLAGQLRRNAGHRGAEVSR